MCRYVCESSLILLLCCFDQPEYFAHQNVPEKPMLDLAASTDRTVSIFDLRVSLSSSMGTMTHPSTPSCIAPSESRKEQVVTGAYDSIARLWDLRSTRGAVTNFKFWDGMNISKTLFFPSPKNRWPQLSPLCTELYRGKVVY